MEVVFAVDSGKRNAENRFVIYLVHMFYSKYRPQKFSDLVGLNAVKDSLLSSLRKRRVGHAYLFSGPRGTGKTTVARLLAKAVNCENIDEDNWNGEPCGDCPSCQAIEEGRFLDLIEIDAASNRRINDVRELREGIGLAPSRGNKKVYIIDEVHMLTREAFNALLKTLEEPPDHAIFILATTEPEQVPATIRSRCQHFEFKRATDQEIREKLESIVEEEGGEISEAALEKVAHIARGGFRDAENMLEQMLVGGLTVEDLTGSGKMQELSDFLRWLIEADTEKALVFLDSFYQRGGNLESFTRELLEFLRDILLIKVGVGSELVSTSEEDFREMEELGKTIPAVNIRLLINKFTQAAQQFSSTPIPTLPLELAVVELTADDDFCLDGEHCSEKANTNSSEVGESDKTEERDKPVDLEKQELLEKVKEEWGKILQLIRPYNHSLEAILRSVGPKQVEDNNTLVLEAYYEFHRQRLVAMKNRRVVEKAIKEVVDCPVKIHCVLGSRKARKESAKKKKEKNTVSVADQATEVFGEDL
ncbi:MAG: DNA polymerase III subunit gamma/tau [Patescibacteria group bacterium]